MARSSTRVPHESPTFVDALDKFQCADRCHCASESIVFTQQVLGHLRFFIVLADGHTIDLWSHHDRWWNDAGLHNSYVWMRSSVDDGWCLRWDTSRDQSVSMRTDWNTIPCRLDWWPSVREWPDDASSIELAPHLTFRVTRWCNKLFLVADGTMMLVAVFEVIDSSKQ